jgi:hypothetical protein
METRTCLAGLLLAASLHAQAWEALPAIPPVPADNPMTADKIELGKQLFFDPRFSATGTVSCNSCHNLMLGGDDGRPTTMGMHGLTGPRNAPMVWNAAFLGTQSSGNGGRRRNSRSPHRRISRHKPAPAAARHRRHAHAGLSFNCHNRLENIRPESSAPVVFRPLAA